MLHAADGFHVALSAVSAILSRCHDLEVAGLIVKGLNGAIASKRVTYDFARLMEGATEIKCSEFGDNVIANM